MSLKEAVRSLSMGAKGSNRNRKTHGPSAASKAVKSVKILGFQS